MAPYWDWNFHRTRTVTVVVDTPHTPSPPSQIQTWFANTPYISANPIRRGNFLIYTYCFEHIVEYVVDESNHAFKYPITVTITSTATSTFTSPINTPRTIFKQSAESSTSMYTPYTGQSASLGGGLRPGSEPPLTTFSSRHKILSGSSPISGLGSEYATPTSSGLSVDGFPSKNALTAYSFGWFSSSAISQGGSVAVGISSNLADSSSGVLSGYSIFPGVSASASATGDGSGGGASATVSAASPTSSTDRTFQLYINNDVPGLNTLAVGESDSGQLIVGGVVDATVLQINNATNMTDLDGNYIYFIPKIALSRLSKRQDNDPTLQYAPNPPADAVTSGFSVENITLSSNSTDGNYTFYTCSTSPDAQPIYVTEIGKTPGSCYSFDLVTMPPPLNSTNTTISSAQASTTTAASSALATASSSSAAATTNSSGPVDTTSNYLSTTGTSNSAVSVSTVGSTGTSGDTVAPTSNSLPYLASSNPAAASSSSPTAATSSNSANTPSNTGASGTSGDTATATSNSQSVAPTTDMSGATLNSQSAAQSSSAATASTVNLSAVQSSDTVAPISSQMAPTMSNTSAAPTSDNPSDVPSLISTAATSISQAATTSNGPVPDTSSSTAQSSTVSRGVVQNAGNYVDQGLYNDPANTRILDADSTSSPSMSVDVCASFCSSYLYFGVETGIDNI
ncbi:hypothetical protein MMC21_001450 [Puttea exsequens]|nr:hypothetical protein [Puttea exsequens]